MPRRPATDTSCPATDALPARRLVDARWVAARLGLAQKTVLHHAARGSLPCYRVLGSVRFDSQEIEALVTDSRCSAGRNKRAATSRIVRVKAQEEM